MSDQDLLRKIITVLNSVQSRLSPLSGVKSNTDSIEDTNTKLDTVNTSIGELKTEMAKTTSYTEASDTSLQSIDGKLDTLATINGKITNGAGTTALKTIDYAHHEIHAGSHFFFTDYDSDVDTASPKYYRLTTPDTTKWVHLMLNLYSEGFGTWALYEDPDVNASGIAASVFNNDRNSLIEAGLAITTDPTSTDDGTLLKTWRTGSGTNSPTRVGSTSRSEEELILKQNEEYFIKFTPDSDNAKTKLELEWYEHTNT